MAKSTVFVGDYTLAQKMDLEAEILAETDAELVIAQCRTEAEVLEALVDCDAIITQWAPVTRPVMERGGRCPTISRNGIGVDNIYWSSHIAKCSLCPPRPSRERSERRGERGVGGEASRRLACLRICETQ